MRQSRALGLMLPLLLLLGCSGTGSETVLTVEPLSKAQVEAAAEKKVVFAHQSVGGNVLEGVRLLAAELDVALPITKTRDFSGSGGGIRHFFVGENGKPTLKLADFSRALAASNLDKVDMAMLKLCFLDFSPGTDAKSLAGEYVRTIRELQEKYRDTRIVAMTAPLTVVQTTGPKAWIKKAMGRYPTGFEVNARRYEFNSVLRREFHGASLFDIANIESHVIGRPSGFEFQGKFIESLDPTITSDGGHLNELGERVVAIAYLKLLAGDSK